MDIASIKWWFNVQWGSPRHAAFEAWLCYGPNKHWYSIAQQNRSKIKAQGALYFENSEVCGFFFCFTRSEKISMPRGRRSPLMSRCAYSTDMTVKTCSPLLRRTSSGWATCLIVYGICMEEHTYETRLPHIHGNVVMQSKISGGKGAVRAWGWGCRLARRTLPWQRT